MVQDQFPVRREVKELSLLYEVSCILSGGGDLKDACRQVLKALSDHMDMRHGTITLLNQHTGEILIEAAHGLTSEQQARGRYRIGEGVTGQVVQTGKPAVVPRISENPMFLDRTGARRGVNRSEVSFLCVPIKTGSVVLGALSADCLFAGEVSLEEDLRLLSIVSSMIAQTALRRQAEQRERQRLQEENINLRRQLRSRFQLGNLVGVSEAMRDVFSLIEQVAPTTTTVLIHGESGTGKELVAQAIHYSSPRAEKRFVKVNCAALPETVLESELFGHERGAFTGAHGRRIGRFELAHEGTIFLDEVGDFSPATQIRLLRVLQEREFERVGGTDTIRVDVRVIAATNRNLQDLIARNQFRDDLYYRLNVFPIYIPPLRDRRADIIPLADFFTDRYSRQLGKSIRGLCAEVVDIFTRYHWPGNARELENVIERAVLLADGDVIHVRHLPVSLQSLASSAAPITTGGSTFKERIANFERQLLIEALRANRGNIAAAARALGTTERIVAYRVRQLNIQPKSFRV